MDVIELERYLVAITDLFMNDKADIDAEWSAGIGHDRLCCSVVDLVLVVDTVELRPQQEHLAMQMQFNCICIIRFFYLQ